MQPVVFGEAQRGRELYLEEPVGDRQSGSSGGVVGGSSGRTLSLVGPLSEGPGGEQVLLVEGVACEVIAADKHM